MEGTPDGRTLGVSCPLQAPSSRRLLLLLLMPQAAHPLFAFCSHPGALTARNNAWALEYWQCLTRCQPPSLETPVKASLLSLSLSPVHPTPSPFSCFSTSINEVQPHPHASLELSSRSS
ncbi:hypothetical protein BD289DRAFT_255343 [Coniella lustricola]|uniref:Uncharacterized protein n=1 Tax=Coniella lustricola TaxID=2025994 RepID=A0A2T3AKN2_9PEZI|nr:hypothetical protein BD289DRAFT_255343 [Coniella lustricola]